MGVGCLVSLLGSSGFFSFSGKMGNREEAFSVLFLGRGWELRYQEGWDFSAASGDGF